MPFKERHKNNNNNCKNENNHQNEINKKLANQKRKLQGFVNIDDIYDNS